MLVQCSLLPTLKVLTLFWTLSVKPPRLSKRPSNVSFLAYGNSTVVYQAMCRSCSTFEGCSLWSSQGNWGAQGTKEYRIPRFCCTGKTWNVSWCHELLYSSLSASTLDNQIKALVRLTKRPMPRLRRSVLLPATRSKMLLIRWSRPSLKLKPNLMKTTVFKSDLYNISAYFLI